jgi:hypothetical protein
MKGGVLKGRLVAGGGVMMTERLVAGERSTDRKECSWKEGYWQQG